MSSANDDSQAPHLNRGILAPAHSATEAQFRQAYELQICRMSCPSCGEIPVAVPTAMDAVTKLTLADCGH